LMHQMLSAVQKSSDDNNKAHAFHHVINMKCQFQ
jgi:hypothetical protein